MRNPYGGENVPDPDSVGASVFTVTLPYSHVACCCGGEWGQGPRDSSVLFLTTVCESKVILK